MKRKFDDDFYLDDTFERKLHRILDWDKTIAVNPYKNYITLTIKFTKTNEICGQIVLDLQEDESGKFCWFYVLAIHPSLRSKGFGSKLLKYAEDYAASLGAKIVYLTANLDNEAFLVNWYQNKGYEKLYRSSEHANEWLFSKKL